MARYWGYQTMNDLTPGRDHKHDGVWHQCPDNDRTWEQAVRSTVAEAQDVMARLTSLLVLVAEKADQQEAAER